MARSPLRFLLLRLAAQNIGRRRLRALFLGIAVMLAVGVGFASFTAGWALRGGIATTFSRMGADLVVVPFGTLVNITSTLLTVQPTEQELDAGLADRLRAIPGVGRVAPQRIVRAQADGRMHQSHRLRPRCRFHGADVAVAEPACRAASGDCAGRRARRRQQPGRRPDRLRPPAYGASAAWPDRGRSVRRILLRELCDP